jgi:hypothetical protein
MRRHCQGRGERADDGSDEELEDANVDVGGGGKDAELPLEEVRVLLRYSYMKATGKDGVPSFVNVWTLNSSAHRMLLRQAMGSGVQRCSFGIVLDMSQPWTIARVLDEVRSRAAPRR